ncbi:hypothetical protein QQA20_02780 [Vibrio parahaemolyticus]|uniref:hypothetical protein n=1 Tax=Vibrio parahaemolyticus TaxID=670 RepID=UPI0004E15089|nr:hypothetical protein [Vibrio parahaemolyticus]MCR9764630.1 hypothetical protein [Vibrio parahaemolyticus]MCR9781684.1 hypothetical protein [Vibrio parahaemolyticus]MCX8913171.1 hypothetical protein [Vibrio parahaemolyticus]MDF4651088.1 hypothetical protein [Vibrio parahaemolyticus]MDG3033190.1 hypothetical protein [Vibrio parahaemolyticus]
MSSINNQIIPPAFIPVDFCSPQRAAEMLNITMDDLWHFCYRGYLPLYIHCEEIPPDGIFPLIEARKVIEVRNGFFAETSGRFLSGFWRVHTMGACSLTYSSSVFDVNPLDTCMSIVAEHVRDDSESCRAEFDGVNFQNAQGNDRDEFDILAQHLARKPDIQDSDCDHVRFVIFGDDLKDIYQAIYKTGSLARKVEAFYLDTVNGFQGEEHYPPKSSRVRVTPQQSDMITALLECLPELKNALNQAPKEHCASVVNDYLANRELPPLNVTDKSIQNWIGRSNYNRHRSGK